MTSHIVIKYTQWALTSGSQPFSLGPLKVREIATDPQGAIGWPMSQFEIVQCFTSVIFADPLDSLSTEPLWALGPRLRTCGQSISKNQFS
jgi:hypothetical protein